MYFFTSMHFYVSFSNILFSSPRSNEFDQSKDVRLQIRFKIERNFFSFFAKIIEGSRIRSDE